MLVGRPLWKKWAPKNRKTRRAPPQQGSGFNRALSEGWRTSVTALVLKQGPAGCSCAGSEPDPKVPPMFGTQQRSPGLQVRPAYHKLIVQVCNCMQGQHPPHGYQPSPVTVRRVTISTDLLNWDSREKQTEWTVRTWPGTELSEPSLKVQGVTHCAPTYNKGTLVASLPPSLPSSPPPTQGTVLKLSQLISQQWPLSVQATRII